MGPKRRRRGRGAGGWRVGAWNDSRDAGGWEFEGTARWWARPGEGGLDAGACLMVTRARGHDRIVGSPRTCPARLGALGWVDATRPAHAFRGLGRSRCPLFVFVRRRLALRVAPETVLGATALGWTEYLLPHHFATVSPKDTHGPFGAPVGSVCACRLLWPVLQLWYATTDACITPLHWRWVAQERNHQWA